MVLTAAMLLSACGSDGGGRVVDAKGKAITTEKLKSIETGIAARDLRERNRTTAQKRSDAIMLNADFRHQLGMKDDLTPLQRSVTARATTGDEKDPVVRQRRLMNSVDDARRRLAMMHVDGVKNVEKTR